MKREELIQRLAPKIATRQSQRRCKKCSQFFTINKGDYYNQLCETCRVVANPPAIKE